MRIEDGGGSNGFALLTKGQALNTFSISEGEQQAATEAGKAYNINTGTIALTGSGDSGLLYFKNDESPDNGESDFVITAIAIGLGTRSATVTDAANVTIIRNPTGGTLVDAATACDMVSNANFGSSNSLSSTTVAYKATADNQTLTGGTDHALLYMTDGRLYAPLAIDLPRGSSIGVKIDLNTSGGANVYCALVGYRKDGKNKA
jgi:hypothetical protein